MIIGKQRINKINFKSHESKLSLERANTTATKLMIQPLSIKELLAMRLITPCIKSISLCKMSLSIFFFLFFNSLSFANSTTLVLSNYVIKYIITYLFFLLQMPLQSFSVYILPTKHSI